MSSMNKSNEQRALLLKRGGWQRSLNKNIQGMKKSTKSGRHLNSMLNTPKLLQRCNILGKADNICQEGDILTQV